MLYSHHPHISSCVGEERPRDPTWAHTWQRSSWSLCHSCRKDHLQNWLSQSRSQEQVSHLKRNLVRTFISYKVFLIIFFELQWCFRGRWDVICMSMKHSRAVVLDQHANWKAWMCGFSTVLCLSWQPCAVDNAELILFQSSYMMVLLWILLGHKNF